MSNTKEDDNALIAAIMHDAFKDVAAPISMSDLRKKLCNSGNDVCGLAMPSEAEDTALVLFTRAGGLVKIGDKWQPTETGLKMLERTFEPLLNKMS